MRRTHSYSKRETLDCCLRKYFYEYYASARHTTFDRFVKQISDCSSVSQRIRVG